jgi:uncharacterized protein (DUF488 family)
MATIFTVGHSTLQPEEFLDLLAAAPLSLLWDVRSYPTSHWEWFTRTEMQRWLPAAGVQYRWVEALGGRRGRPPAGTAAVQVAGEGEAGEARTGQASAGEAGHGWTAEGFVNYEWHTLTDEFRAAAEELVHAAAREPVAIMCAEGVWWHCHRSMIADYLVVRGAEVVHLQPRRTVHADVVADRLPRYRSQTLVTWRAQGRFGE